MTSALTKDGPFPHLPDSARVWIFGVSRTLEAEEESRLLLEVDRFLSRWKAHGHPLSAAREWRLGRFLLIGLDERVTPPSGCSIDALVRILRDLESEFGAEIVGSAPVWYREGGPTGKVRRVSRPEFKQRAANGDITEDTTVFDLSLTRVGEVRRGKWELAAGESWHRRYLE